MLGGAAALAAASVFSAAAFFVVNSESAGISEDAAGLLLSATSAGVIVARILLGVMADRGRTGDIVTVAALLVASAGGYALMAADTPWLYALGGQIAIILGWSWPALMVVALVRMNPHAPGLASSFAVGGLNLGAVLGPAAFGAISDAASSSAALVVAAVVDLRRGRPLPAGPPGPGPGDGPQPGGLIRSGHQSPGTVYRAARHPGQSWPGREGARCFGGSRDASSPPRWWCSSSHPWCSWSPTSSPTRPRCPLPLEATEEHRAQRRASLGIDRPLAVQYWDFVSGLVVGDLGESFWQDQPAAKLVLERLPATLKLVAGATVVTVLLAAPMGMLAAWWERRFADHAVLGFSMAAISAPPFWIGYLLIIVFAVQLGWVPTFGSGGFVSLILPSFAIGLASAGRLSQMTRRGIVEELRKPYAVTALSRGFSGPTRSFTTPSATWPRAS